MSEERRLALKEFEGAVTEIGANMTLAAKDDYNKGWNDASRAANKVIGRYIRGIGLFQDYTKPPSPKRTTCNDPQVG